MTPSGPVSVTSDWQRDAPPFESGILSEVFVGQTGGFVD
jgi:hypothetical protein